MTLNARQIKIIACVSMLFSHVGLIFFPWQLWWQIPGRIAMPLFAFMIANGARHSRDNRRYAARLLIYALLIQYPYSIFMGLGYLNICFTLGLGIVAIMFWQSSLPAWVRDLAVIGLAFVAEAANCEYGLYGVAMVVTAHVFFEDKRKLALAWLVVNLPYLIGGAIDWVNGSSWPYVQGLCLLALPFVWLYNGQKGHGWRWEFYAFYIGHMAVLYGARLWLFGY